MNITLLIIHLPVILRADHDSHELSALHEHLLQIEDQCIRGEDTCCTVQIHLRAFQLTIEDEESHGGTEAHQKELREDEL